MVVQTSTEVAVKATAARLGKFRPFFQKPRKRLEDKGRAMIGGGARGEIGGLSSLACPPCACRMRRASSECNAFQGPHGRVYYSAGGSPFRGGFEAVSVPS